MVSIPEETSFAFEQAGFQSTIRHINDLAENPQELEDVQVLCIPVDFHTAMIRVRATPLRKRCA